MPRLKTRSEVATLAYLRAYTSVPVPIVYYVDENPYARVGGELVIMSEVSFCFLRFSNFHLSIFRRLYWWGLGSV